MAATLLVSTFRYLAEARKVAVLVVHRRSACAFWERLCCSLGSTNSPVNAATNNRHQHHIKHGMSGMMHAPNAIPDRPPCLTIIDGRAHSWPGFVSRL